MPQRLNHLPQLLAGWRSTYTCSAPFDRTLTVDPPPILPSAPSNRPLSPPLVFQYEYTIPAITLQSQQQTFRGVRASTCTFKISRLAVHLIRHLRTASGTLRAGVCPPRGERVCLRRSLSGG
ncbi:hypothetical protein IE81DRAFT_130976 [Ceraceosorus guamensis]|uniref:Uncharacterized protein n=1 Tax=Ceraceosorus guamensis TaxID=1522189 RepID=A0A316W7N8_9BASI|nr:hypothetical protein IE81DRAFT_130976 [Ceraceosorus guamensis]PWN45930.1 hypothetical protein IE81DRAFT_130976 [Ceraceosorus guamensis]